MKNKQSQFIFHPLAVALVLLLAVGGVYGYERYQTWQQATALAEAAEDIDRQNRKKYITSSNQSGGFTTSHYDNTYIGNQTGLVITTGTRNTAVGWKALEAALNKADKSRIDNVKIVDGIIRHGPGFATMSDEEVYKALGCCYSSGQNCKEPVGWCK